MSTGQTMTALPPFLALPIAGSTSGLVESAYLGGDSNYETFGWGPCSRASSIYDRSHTTGLCAGFFHGDNTRFALHRDVDISALTQENQVLNASFGSGPARPGPAMMLASQALGAGRPPRQQQVASVTLVNPAGASGTPAQTMLQVPHVFGGGPAATSQPRAFGVQPIEAPPAACQAPLYPQMSVPVAGSWNGATAFHDVAFGTTNNNGSNAMGAQVAHTPPPFQVTSPASLARANTNVAQFMHALWNPPAAELANTAAPAMILGATNAPGSLVFGVGTNMCGRAGPNADGLAGGYPLLGPDRTSAAAPWSTPLGMTSASPISNTTISNIPVAPFQYVTSPMDEVNTCSSYGTYTSCPNCVLSGRYNMQTCYA